MFFLLLEPPCLLLSFSNCWTPMPFPKILEFWKLEFPFDLFRPFLIAAIPSLVSFSVFIAAILFLVFLSLISWLLSFYCHNSIFEELNGFLSLKFFIRINPLRDRITSPNRNIFLGSNFFVVHRIREYSSSKGSSSSDILSFFAHTK